MLDILSLLNISLMYSETLPRVLRHLIRNNKYTHPTSGCCSGYIQANIIIMHKSVADQFLAFLKANKAPCPLLHYSEPGDFTAAPLTHTEPSNIITDLPSYVVIKNGVVMETVSDLKHYSDVLNEYQTFYIGCSFSFERALLANHIPLRNTEQCCNVPMYITNIKTVPIGLFNNTYMVVSMRPIPKYLLLKTFEITAKFEDTHGVPIHVGDPTALGISDINKPDYGNLVTFQEGDVPVFWACGVTSNLAVRQAQLDLVIAHNPGHMFITDISCNERQLSKICEEYYIRDMPTSKYITFLSHSIATKLRLLEEFIMEDTNNRGIKHLMVEDDFAKACLVLSHSKTVALISEFPCFGDDDVPFETDGIPGILALAKLLLKLEKKVYLLSNHPKMRPILEKCVLEFDWLKNPNLQICNTDEVRAAINVPDVIKNISDVTKNSTNVTINSNISAVFDCILTLEHSGPAADDRYYTMNGRDITKCCSLIDKQIASLSQADRYDSRYLVSQYTIGVGDGGNEYGMGKKYSSVVDNITNGPIIACRQATDYLIASGVSNWGGQALACGVYLLYKECSVHRQFVTRSIIRFSINSCDLFSCEDQKLSLKLLNALGVRDGVNGKLNMSVDNIDIESHERKLTQLYSVID